MIPAADGQDDHDRAVDLVDAIDREAGKAAELAEMLDRVFHVLADTETPDAAAEIKYAMAGFAVVAEVIGDKLETVRSGTNDLYARYRAATERPVAVVAGKRAPR